VQLPDEETEAQNGKNSCFKSYNRDIKSESFQFQFQFRSGSHARGQEGESCCASLGDIAGGPAFTIWKTPPSAHEGLRWREDPPTPHRIRPTCRIRCLGDSRWKIKHKPTLGQWRGLRSVYLAHLTEKRKQARPKVLPGANPRQRVERTKRITGNDVRRTCFLEGRVRGVRKARQPPRACAAIACRSA
jgi:hypothetical protein